MADKPLQDLLTETLALISDIAYEVESLKSRTPTDPRFQGRQAASEKTAFHARAKALQAKAEELRNK